VVDLADALDTLASGEALPPRAVALTFDDGYRDNLTDAVPILQELGLDATFFLVPSVLSGTTTPWWELVGAALARSVRGTLWWEGQYYRLDGRTRQATCDLVCESLKGVDERTRQLRVRALVEELHPGAEADVEPLFLDWDDARALVKSGMRVGSHSLEHVILANEAAEQQRRDLKESRRLLECELDTEISLLAYPNGGASDFDDVSERAARAAGYQGAVTTLPGRNSAATNPFRLRRFLLSPEHGVVGLRWVLRQRLQRHAAHPGPRPSGAR